MLMLLVVGNAVNVKYLSQIGTQMMKRLFDPKAFGLRVKRKIEAHNYSLRELASLIGVSYASISRVTRGHPPLVENYFRLKYWLEQ